MEMRSLLTVGVLAASLVTIGCGSNGGNPVTATSGTYTGTWTGSPNSLVGRLNIRLVLTQTGSSLSGTYSCLSPGCAFSSGSVSGAVSGDTLNGSVSFLNGAAACGTFTGRRSGDSISGSYGCSWGDSGTWTAAR